MTALDVEDVRAMPRDGVDPPVRLRPATASDAGEIAALRAASWQAAYAGIVDAETLDAMTGVVPPWLAERCPAPAGQLTMVAETPGGELLGFVMAHVAREEPGVGEVVLIYVRPQAWRPRCGDPVDVRGQRSRTALLRAVRLGRRRRPEQLAGGCAEDPGSAVPPVSPAAAHRKRLGRTGHRRATIAAGASRG